LVLPGSASGRDDAMTASLNLVFLPVGVDGLCRAKWLLWLRNPRWDGKHGENIGNKLVGERVLVLGKRGRESPA
jgi:hypothetical protein